MHYTPHIISPSSLQVAFETFFGFDPQLDVSISVLADENTPRGFSGSLSNLRLRNGSLAVVMSDSSGLHLSLQ